MPRSVRHTPEDRAFRRASTAGQSLVEFGLILPLMLVFLLALADLGRLFASAIVVQAASRDGAEAAAQEYVQLARNATIDPTTFYGTIHAKAEAVACAEAQRLPGVTVDSNGDCTQPVIAICVHDSGYPIGGVTQPGDPGCGAYAGTAAPSCSGVAAAWTTVPDPTGLPYVEVRICDRFDMLTQVPTFHLGPLYLQQTSTFVAALY